MNGEKSVVFGSGPLGRTIAEMLASHGKKVILINRSGEADVSKAIKVVKGDVLNVEACIDITEGATAIYNCIGLPYADWQQQFPKIIQAMIEISKATKSKLVHADNLYAYGPHQNTLSEDTTPNPVGIKQKVRLQMTEMILAAHYNNEIVATIGRAPDFYGPGVENSSLGVQVFGNAITHKKANLIGDVDQPHAYIYIKDFAKGLITLAENELANGQIWHIPNGETKSTRAVVELIYKKLGIEPKLLVANGLLLNFLSLFSKDMKELKEMYYQFKEPFRVNSNKFSTVFYSDFTPLEKGIEETIDWYRTQEIAQ